MPFVPSDISGLRLWLKADAITGLNDGDPVGTWADSSGLGNNAAQATASKKPTYKTNVLNGKPVVRFDGVDDYMTGGALSTGSGTVFVVAKQTSVESGAVQNPLISTRPTQTYFELLFGGSGTDSSQVIAQINNGSFAGVRNGTPGTDFVIAEAVFNGPAATISAGINGSLDSTVDLGSLGVYSLSNASGYTIAQLGGLFADYYLNGDIAEVIYYNSALSTTDRQSVEGYLTTKYFVAPTVTAPVVSFHDIVYPLSLDRCVSAWEWLTNIMELGGGEEQRIPQGADGRRKFDASHGVRSLSDLQTLLKFHALRHGETYGFKVRDLVDYTVAKGPEGTLQYTYDGTTKSFQLQKVYSDAAATWIREIYKPEQGSVKVYKNSVLLLEGVGYTLNYATGVITLTAAPVVGDVIEWEGRFYVPVRFAVKEIPAAEFVATMYEDAASNQWLVKDGSADLPEVPMVETKDIL